MMKLIGQILGFIIGSFVSPSWVLMNYTLKGYFNLEKALSSPQDFLQQYHHFYLITATNPAGIFLHLVPALILILIIGTLFMALIIQICGKVMGLIGDRLHSHVVPS